MITFPGVGDGREAGVLQFKVAKVGHSWVTELS